MYLARVIPAVAGHPELQSFACRTCREATTQEAGSPAADREEA
jgi:hypothetical protein